MPSGGKRRGRTTSGNTERRRSWSENWRNSTPEMGSSSSECLLLSAFSFKGSIGHSCSGASDGLNVWGVSNYGIRSISTVLYSRTSDSCCSQILFLTQKIAVSMMALVVRLRDQWSVIFCHLVESSSSVLQADTKKFSGFRSLQRF